MKSQDSPKILLVDDDPEMVASASALLRREGNLVTVASNQDEAFSQLGLKAFDLILLDLGLPREEDGFNLLQTIKEKPSTKRLPVIMLTAWNSPEHKVRALDLGATDYVTKPFEAAELKARVRCAIRTKRLQEELASANEQLKMARDQAEIEAKAKAGLLAFKSHEIRSFMNGILPNAGFLGSTNLSDEQRDYVETIRQSSENILNIVNDILDFSRIESGKLELECQPFDLRKCVEDALDTLAPKAGEKHLDLVYSIGDGIPEKVRGDVIRLRQILVNLIGNAVKFTQAGEVVVEVEPGRSGEIHIRVVDTGIGIPKEKQDRLFKPFSQADASTTRQFGGSGLGLSISQRLIELMGGQIGLESEGSNGTTFQLSIPLPAAADSNGTTFSKLQSPLTRMDVLIIEDNDRIQSQLTNMLSRWGCTIKTASTASAAIEIMNASPGFDVVFLDSTLENEDPTAFATRLRLARAATRAKFVLMSPTGTRIHSSIFSAYLSKPLKPLHIKDTLRRLSSGASQAPKKTPVTPSGKLSEVYPLSVLVCDDNMVNLKVATRMLTQLGYEPHTAANGVQALEAFESQHYDLVFMDVQMPEMDGFEATARLRERYSSAQQPAKPAPRIIAMTASAMPGDRERCLKAGMDDYLSKPVRPDDLKKAVEKWGKQITPVPEAKGSGESEQAEAPTQESSSGRILDWERLMELADNDREMLKELVNLYIQETEKQMEQLGAAVASQSALDVKRLAHKCAGGSATIGVGRLVPLLRELESRGEMGKLDGTGSIYEQARKEFQILRGHLELHPNGVVEVSTR